MRGRLTPSEVRNAIQKACDAQDYDPFVELIKLATEKTRVKVDGKVIEVHALDADQRITVAKEIASYMAPKLKNIEVKGEVDNNIHITVTNFSEMPAATVLDAKAVVKELEG